MCSVIPLISFYISLITDDVYPFLYTYLPYLYKTHIMWWGIYWNSLSVYLLVCLFSYYQFKRAFYTLWTHLFEAYLVNFIIPINIFLIGVFFGVYVFNLDEENLSFFCNRSCIQHQDKYFWMYIWIHSTKRGMP